jgi:hypothetical protein
MVAFVSIVSLRISTLRPRLLFLLLPQRTQTHTRDLDNLEPHTRNITLCLALATEPSKQYLVILVHEIQATVIWHYISQSSQS